MGVCLTGTIVLSLDFKLIALFSASLLTPMLHSSCWQWAQSLPREREATSTSTVSPFLSGCIYLYLFSTNISPSGLSSKILWCILPLLFSFLYEFISFSTSVFFFFPVISGKDRTWMHVLSLPFWTWRPWSYLWMLLLPKDTVLLYSPINHVLKSMIQPNSQHFHQISAFFLKCFIDPYPRSECGSERLAFESNRKRFCVMFLISLTLSTG